LPTSGECCTTSCIRWLPDIVGMLVKRNAVNALLGHECHLESYTRPEINGFRWTFWNPRWAGTAAFCMARRRSRSRRSKPFSTYWLCHVDNCGSDRSHEPIDDLSVVDVSVRKQTVPLEQMIAITCMCRPIVDLQRRSVRVLARAVRRTPQTIYLTCGRHTGCAVLAPAPRKWSTEARRQLRHIIPCIRFIHDVLHVNIYLHLHLYDTRSRQQHVMIARVKRCRQIEQR